MNIVAYRELYTRIAKLLRKARILGSYEYLQKVEEVEKLILGTNLEEYRNSPEKFNEILGIPEIRALKQDPTNTHARLKAVYFFEHLASMCTDKISEDEISSGKQHSRYELLNFLIAKHSYKKYLEIGCRDDACFNKVNAPDKTGVDPNSGGTHRMTSDAFFAQCKETYDLIFVDGLHESEQVYRDIENSLNHLSENGTIVVHDCNPLFEIRQFKEPIAQSVWNGDVWKAFVAFRQREDLDCIVADFDHGCGIIRKRKNSSTLKIEKTIHDLKWEDLDSNRDHLLRLASMEEVQKWA